MAMQLKYSVLSHMACGVYSHAFHACHQTLQQAVSQLKTEGGKGYFVKHDLPYFLAIFSSCETYSFS